MADLVSISVVKLQLRISDNTEDILLQQYIRAATLWITKFLNCPIPGYGDSPQTAAPDDIVSAALLIISDLYENREAASEKDYKQNPRMLELLQFYREDIGM